mmetsp:Transcript_2891/g.8467  ORF Transcript_2891/g.8467 Transcript_2891/m.8467 type:complete len:258 (-) Transcript_2891:462-1235(-)
MCLLDGQRLVLPHVATPPRVVQLAVHRLQHVRVHIPLRNCLSLLRCRLSRHVRHWLRGSGGGASCDGPQEQIVPVLPLHVCPRLGRLPQRGVHIQIHCQPLQLRSLAQQVECILVHEDLFARLVNCVRAQLFHGESKGNWAPRYIHVILVANVNVADFHLQVADDGVNHGPQEATTTGAAIRSPTLVDAEVLVHPSKLLVIHGPLFGCQRGCLCPGNIARRSFFGCNISLGFRAGQYEDAVDLHDDWRLPQAAPWDL